LLAPRENRAFVRGGGHRVRTGDAHRRVRVAQLGRRRAEPLRELRSLRVVLAPIHHHQRDGDHRARDRGQRGLDHVDIAGSDGVCEDRTADDPGCQRGEAYPDDDRCGERSEQRNPWGATARGGTPDARCAPQGLCGPERPREQTTDNDADNRGGRDPDGQAPRNRQAGALRHRTQAECPENRPARGHRGGKDDHRHHPRRGVADQPRSPQGGVRVDLGFFLLVAAVGTGDFLDVVGDPLGHHHIVSSRLRRSPAKSARLRTGLSRWSSVKKHDHRRTDPVP